MNLLLQMLIIYHILSVLIQSLMLVFVLKICLLTATRGTKSGFGFGWRQQIGFKVVACFEEKLYGNDFYFSLNSLTTHSMSFKVNLC